jgi:uncharacterized metal-binding protein YceD (DUF177 family)
MMKIPVGDVKPELMLTLSGEEPWLGRIYADLNQPLAKLGEKASSAKIAGTLTLILEPAGTVIVSCKLTYEPSLPCARCDKILQWPLKLNFQTRFFEPQPDEFAEKDKNLSKDELDVYYLDDEGVDVEMVINDAIQTALPSYLVQTTEDGDHCRICLDKLGDVSFEDPAGANLSPFAALKNLKKH